MNWERIFSIYVDRKGGDSFGVRFEEELMGNGPFQGQVIGEEEVTKEVLGTWIGRNV
jgi:hypothetical protein